MKDLKMGETRKGKFMNGINRFEEYSISSEALKIGDVEDWYSYLIILVDD